MSFLTSKSKSENKSYPWLNQAYGGISNDMVQRGATGLMQAQNFLTGSDTSGFDQYKRSTGYDNIFGEAMRGVTSNAAARGLLGSGATLRATQDRAGQLAQQQYANYLQQLMGNAQTQFSGGQNLAGLIAQGGQTSTSRGGLLDAVGGIGAGLGALGVKI